jgi:hypothetical protein
MSPRVRFTLYLTVIAVLLAWAALGCSSSSGSGSPDAGAGGGGGSGADTLLGTFHVTLVPLLNGNPAHTEIQGRVSNGPTPAAIILEKAGQSGACTLFTPRIPFCSTPCGGSAVCVADDVCQSNPTKQDVGTATLTGLKVAGGGTSVSIEATNGNYILAGVDLLFPPFDEGAAVALTTTGGVYPALSIQALGIAPLVVPADTLTLQKDHPLTVTWTPAGAAGRSTVHLKLDISHHGGSKGQIECDSADQGSVVIAASLVTQLYNLGLGGYNYVTLTRKTAGSASIAAGRVDLEIAEDVDVPVEIPGVTECLVDSDCPTGHTCPSSLLCN